MKKVFLTAIVAAAFAFGMTACNNNAPAEQTTDTTEVCCEHEHECCHHQCNCEDTTCAATQCENCTNENCCCKLHAGDTACCKGNHEGCEGKHECCKGNHEGCKGNHEGCKKECAEKK